MSNKEKELEYCIREIFWMARRYAHGRNTFAPGTVREVYHKLEKLGIDIKRDHTIEPPKDEDIKGMNFRTDYLDDINV